MSLYCYLTDLTRRIFKILPMREDEFKGTYVYLDVYLESLSVEMSGATSTFPALSSDSDYIAVLNTVNGLMCDSYDVTQTKREVFKALNLIRRIIDRFGGEDRG